MPQAAVAIVGVVATLASTAVGIMSAVSQSSARATGYQGASTISSYNQDVAKTQAEAIRRQGALQEQFQRERARRLLGTQVARYGASGVDLEGSPLMVITDSAFQAARDAETTRANAEYQAGLAEANANIYGMKAAQYGEAADSAGDGLGSSILASGLSGLSTASKFGLFKIPTWGSSDALPASDLPSGWNRGVQD